VKEFVAVTNSFVTLNFKMRLSVIEPLSWFG